MRIRMLAAWLLMLIGVAGCQARPEPERGEFDAIGRLVVERLTSEASVGLVPAATDAAAPAAASTVAASAAAAAPVVTALDPVVTQLLGAALRSYEVQRRVIAENIANVNTAGFKKRVVRIGQQDVVGGSGDGVQVPVIQGIDSVFTGGTLEATERALDFAIDGEGFFAVQLADGTTGYTRASSFQLDRDGKLVTSAGNILRPEITAPSDLLSVSIDPLGLVSGRTAGAPDVETRLGQITIHRFVAPQGLRLQGGIYLADEAAGSPFTGTPGSDGLGTLKQGFVERSNVQIATELLNLQVLERQHQTLQRVLREFGLIAP